jgi:type II secretory pathway predicted ATPase ExeA
MSQVVPLSPKVERVFFQTRAAQIACQSLDRVLSEAIIGMIVAAPGVGKTQSINYWRRKQGATFRHVSIQADVLTSCRPILNALLTGLSITAGRNMSHSKQLICEELARHPLPVILDEADLLTVRAFELLRSVWDRVAELRGSDGEHAFPLMLVGTPHLRDMLSRDDLERLRRRTFHKAELPPLSRDELRAVLKKWPGLEWDDEGLEELLRLSRGSFGWLNNIIPIAQKLAAKDGKVLTARILRATSKYLIGLPEQE